MLNIMNRLVAAPFLIFGLSYGIALAGSASPDVVYKVSLENWEFTPAELTIQPGDTVTWLNDDDTDHNLGFYEVRPATGPTDKKPEDLSVGKKYSLVFNQKGVFKYVCTIHKRQDMKGTVIVK